MFNFYFYRIQDSYEPGNKISIFLNCFLANNREVNKIINIFPIHFHRLYFSVQLYNTFTENIKGHIMTLVILNTVFCLKEYQVGTNQSESDSAGHWKNSANDQKRKYYFTPIHSLRIGSRAQNYSMDRVAQL